MTKTCFTLAVLTIFLASTRFVTGRTQERSDGVGGATTVQLEQQFFEAMKANQIRASRTSGSADYEVLNNVQVGKSNAKMPIPEVIGVSMHGENCMKVVRQERGIEVHEIVNDSYVFVLSRTKRGAFSIAGVYKPGSNVTDELLLRDKMNSARYLLMDAYSYYGRTIWGLVSDPGFKLTKIHSFQNDAGEERVRVEFDYAPVNKLHEGTSTIDDWTLTGAYLVFSTRDGWKLTEYGRPGYPRSVTTVNQHPSDQLGFTETAIARVIAAEDGTVKREDRVTLLKSSYDSIPKDHFFLKHYGFPEPNFLGRTRWPWIFGGIALGVFCMLVAGRILRQQKVAK